MEHAARRILVVDDNTDICNLLRMLLVRSGHCVWASEDPYIGFSTAVKHLPDVAILDIAMPGMDGFHLCRLLRTLDPAPRVLLMTGAPIDDSCRRLAKIHGAAAIFQKPLPIDELMAEILK